jgi:YHS domain-containing protein
MKEVNSSQTFIDPVCAMRMLPGCITHTFAYRDHTYYFCTETCLLAFSANPEKYLNPEPAKPKGIWARYMDRLTKATGGRALQCH